MAIMDRFRQVQPAVPSYADARAEVVARGESNYRWQVRAVQQVVAYGLAKR